MVVLNGLILSPYSEKAAVNATELQRKTVKKTVDLVASKQINLMVAILCYVDQLHHFMDVEYQNGSLSRQLTNQSKTIVAHGLKIL